MLPSDTSDFFRNTMKLTPSKASVSGTVHVVMPEAVSRPAVAGRTWVVDSSAVPTGGELNDDLANVGTFHHPFTTIAQATEVAEGGIRFGSAPECTESAFRPGQAVFRAVLSCSARRGRESSFEVRTCGRRDGRRLRRQVAFFWRTISPQHSGGPMCFGCLRRRWLETRSSARS